MDEKDWAVLVIPLFVSKCGDKALSPDNYFLRKLNAMLDKFIEASGSRKVK